MNKSFIAPFVRGFGVLLIDKEKTVVSFLVEQFSAEFWIVSTRL